MQEIIKTPIDGLKILKPLIHKDSRGFFFESFNQKIFNSTLGNTIKFVQDNHSFSKKCIKRFALTNKKTSRKTRQCIKW